MQYTVLSYLITASLLTSCNIANSEHEATAKRVDFTTPIDHFITETPVHEFQTFIIESTSDAEIFYPTSLQTTSILINCLVLAGHFGAVRV